MLQVIGAGLPRTATSSLQLAMPRLTGGPCYHMVTVNEQPEHIPVWQAALDGNPPDWPDFLADYTAAVDWPASAFWEELAESFPQALILLSTRTDGATWWRSADATIMGGLRDPDYPEDWLRLDTDLWRRTLGPSWDDPADNAAAYQRWVDRVRRTAPADRLLEWQASDGWGPLCEALGSPVPDEPFPSANSTVEWADRQRQKDLEKGQPNHDS